MGPLAVGSMDYRVRRSVDGTNERLSPVNATVCSLYDATDTTRLPSRASMSRGIDTFNASLCPSLPWSPFPNENVSPLSISIAKFT